MIRILKPGDEEVLEEFLLRHAASSMFMRSNAARGGLTFLGQAQQAIYAAALDGDRIVGVAAHCWHGILLLQAPQRLPELVRAAAGAAPLPVAGFLGPWDQVVAARAALGLTDAPARCESPEDLFDLQLKDLRLPPELDVPGLVVRRLRPEDVEDFAQMQVEYQGEALGTPRDDELVADERSEAERDQREGSAFIARLDGRVVAVSLFNARLPDCVQVGGVFTPRELRGRGLARAVVGASLAMARDEGVARAILFTGRDNEPARRAYLSLGFRIVGDYGIVLLSK